ncbi:MAG TPA: hypothetical protein VMF30_15555, partial [Pirellulales bacterium]|nr:hypothetical protein [Pirellulales bacterium]
LARRDYGSSSTAGGALTAVAEGTQTDRELTLYRHNLIESLDSLFGRDVEWAGGSAASQGTATSSDQFDREAGAVSLTERPSAAMLAVGLAISALWTEVEASDTVDRKAKTRESLLRRRRVAP